MGKAIRSTLIPAFTALILSTAALANTTVCPKGDLTSGLDVSLWQVVTDWKQVESSVHAFAFIKAVQGLSATAEDPKFLVDWPAAKNVGLMRSAYDFFEPNEDAQQQAANFISILQKNGVGELPPMLDIEVTNGAKPAQVLANAQIWLDQVETWLREDQKMAWTPIIYTSSGFWNALTAPASFARYPLFIADPSHDCPTIPAPWTTWTFWQRKAGSVPGVQNAVDIDFFSGTLSMLEAFASATGL